MSEREILNHRSPRFPNAKALSMSYDSLGILVRRFLATMVDFALLAAPLYFAGIFFSKDVFAEIITLWVVFSFVYYFILEGLFGATLGKFLLKLRVVNIDGKIAGIRKCIIRTVLRLLEVNPFVLGCLISGVVVLVSKGNQRLGDIMANTYVVKTGDLAFIDRTLDVVVRKKFGLEYVGFGKRLLASLLDGMFFIPLFPVIKWLTVYSFENKTVIPHLAYGCLMISIWVFMVIKFGGSPGKLILRLKIVNVEGKFLTLWQAIRRSGLGIIVFLVSDLQLYTTSHSVTLYTPLDFGTAVRVMNSYGALYYNLSLGLNLLFIVDALFILFTEKKRALHDFWTGSFVVAKERK